MDTLESLQNQLKTTEGQMAGYSADLPSEIETQLQKAYSPILKESLGVTKNLMGDYLSRYYDTTQMGPGMAGTTAKDLSPTQKLGVMGRELGTMAGDLQATQKYSDYLGGQMNDAYSKALQAAQLGQQNLSDQYSRLFQQYQMAWQEAEAEKDRALQRELARASGGGGGTPLYPGGGETQNPQQVNTPNDDVDITIPSGGNNNWTNAITNSNTRDTSKWLTNNPVTTTTNLIGNLLGNWNTNKSFLDKLLNR